MTDYEPLVREMYDSIADQEHLDENIDRYLAEDFVEHAEVPGMAPTRETAHQLFRALHGALRGLHVEVHDVLQDGDRVAARITFRGVPRGGADGDELGADAIDVLEFRDGRCVAHWAAGDVAGLLERAAGAEETPAVRSQSDVDRAR